MNAQRAQRIAEKNALMSRATVEVHQITRTGSMNRFPMSPSGTTGPNNADSFIVVGDDVQELVDRHWIRLAESLSAFANVFAAGEQSR